MPDRRPQPPLQSPTLPAGASPTAAAASPASSQIPPAPAVPRINQEENAVGTVATGTHTSTALSPESGSTRSEILTVTSGPEEGRIYRLKVGETWIGRSKDCDIVLVANGVSRKHACITRTRSRVVIRDNGAKNGTTVDDRPIVEHELRPGEEIRLGSNASLLYSGARNSETSERRNASAPLALPATAAAPAKTTNALIELLANELRGAPVSSRVAELLHDLRESAGLASQQPKRRSEVALSFNEPASRELAAERRECDLATMLTERVDAVYAGPNGGRIFVVTHWPPDAKFPWVGSPTGMAKVVEQLLEHCCRVGYADGRSGVIDVRLKSAKGRYRLEIEDYGEGVAPEVLARMFDSGRGALAGVHSIVTSVFGGEIICRPSPGKGTRFVIVFPVVTGFDTSPV